jgi:alpha-tubulin suppressor-like RCC1 family protein
LPLPQTKDKKDRTAIKIASSAKRRFVLANDNTVFYTGQKSKNYSLPDDQTKDKWTELKLSKDTYFDDKVIVDLYCGNHYTFFVTSKGNLYALGGQFWDKYA